MTPLALRAAGALLLLWVAAALAPAAAQPVIAARAYTLVDAASGATLAANAPDARLEPASLSKLMTAYVVFGALAEKRITADDPVKVSREAFLAPGKGGSRMFLEPGRPVTVSELLRGLIAASGNDAAVALAEHVAGTVPAFVARMNAEAQRLGMTNTRFANPTGLPDPQHYSSAADLATLAMRLYADYPQHMGVFTLREFTYNSITQTNRNRLLWVDPHIDGMKTGHHETAGWCLVASAARPQGSGAAAYPRRLIAVVLGAPTESLRAQESLRLLNYGFTAFDTVRLYRKDQVVAEPRVWKGDRATVPLGFARDMYVTVARADLERLGGAGLKPMLERPEPLLGPIRAGARVATMRVMAGDRVVAEMPVVALADVGEAGFFGRAYDAVRLWLGK